MHAAQRWLGLASFFSVLLGGCGSSGSGGTTGSGEQDLVITRLSFARQMPAGVSVGFHLTDNPGLCGQGSLKDPDGNPGINNQLSLVLPEVDMLTNGTLDPLVQDSINQGSLLYGVRGLDMPPILATGDGSPTLEFRLLGGMPSVGSDMRLNANQTFDTLSGSPVSTTQATLKDGVIDAGPFELVMPVRVLDAQFNVTVHGAHARINLAADGSASGVLGGGIVSKELSDYLTTKAIGSALQSLLPSLLAGIADLAPDASGQCQQFSAALTFDAKHAFINP